ncbi:hypothetical protein [Limnohabitans sp. 15K]|uniref:hypothetical protein n=1 Tax=Limnohabitans sp. 15K TaxID=1100706 RepID=UPI001E2A6356|nr:hypothetical protein [Limnohabitans sp. 15K]
MKRTSYFLFWRAVGPLLASLLAGTAFAQPLVTCQVTYAGATQTVVARPVADPYPVPSVDIGGRFAFKAVMVGDAQKVERMVLYAYLVAQPHPVLIHQAKYLPPFPRSVTPWAFTGQQHVYGGPQERELIYSCTLEGWAP